MSRSEKTSPLVITTVSNGALYQLPVTDVGWTPAGGSTSVSFGSLRALT
jgi:hypothetical protein